MNLREIKEWNEHESSLIVKYMNLREIKEWIRLKVNFFILDNLSYFLMVHVAKIIEIIGSSDKGWEEAAQIAVDEAKKTIHGITGVEITDMTAKVDPNTGRITQYRAAVKIAFGVEHES